MPSQEIINELVSVIKDKNIEQITNIFDSNELNGYNNLSCIYESS